MKKKYVNRIKIASFKVKPKKTLTLAIRLNSKYSRNCSLKKCSVILLFFVFFSAFSQLSEVEKKAEQLFEEGEYTEAYKLYAQLVSNQPKNPLYNYRLGVCMIFSEPDKKKCFSYLLQAYKQKQELPKDVAFFLGKAYHLNYRFNEALKYYNEFKETAPSFLQKKYEVDREIRCCVNGKQLLSEITGLEVLQKKTLNESDYFRSYDIQTLDGKMLAKPDEFKTSADRKKKDKSVVFVPNKSSKIFFSSYGDNTSNGKDIYYRIRLPSGDFGKPVPVSAINTPYDEDYPYLCPDGKTLYFSSKGHNSMGGYDIFKTVYDENTDTWSPPENLEFPINSPDDDYLYVPMADGKTAFFSTSRYSPPGKTDVLKISTERKPMPVAAMHAEVVKENASQSVMSRITIRNLDADTLVGKFEADQEGKLEMILPNGANLLYTVETPGLPNQSENVRIPYSKNLKHYRQVIAYENKKLKIINYFEEPKTDDSYIQYLKIIEEKAKLDPERYIPTIVKEIKGDAPVAKDTEGSTEKPTVTDMSSPSSGPDATSLKKTESLLAKNKSQQSAADNQISTLSKKMAELKKSSEEKKQKADEILSSIPEEQRESNPEALKAIEIKKEAEKEEILARMMEQQIQQTEKQKELLREEEQLLTQKKEILSAVVNNPSSYTQEKENLLSELDKKLTAVSESQTPITNAYSPQLKNTEEQIALTEKEIRTLERAITDKEAEISDMEEQLQNTKKKKQKEELKKNIASSIQEVQRLKEQKKSKEEDLASLKTEEENQKLALKEVQKILESIPPTAVQNENTQDVSASASPVPLKEIEKSYSSSIQPYDPQNPDAYLDASEKIIDYNKKIDASILAYKNMLNAEKNPQKAKAIRNEITQLENRKKQNIRLLEEYAKKREVLILENKMLLTQTPPSVPVLNESDAQDNEKLKKIEEITTKDHQYFSQYVTTSENSVQNKESKSAFEELNKQKEVLVTLSRELQNLNASASGASSAELQKKAEQVMQQADSIRKEAQNKPDNERVTLIQKANQLEKEYLNLQVQAYEAKAVENEKRSVLLQNDYQQLLNATRDENKKQQWQQRMEEIKNTQRQFQEIFRESKNTPNPSAKLGNLENALEKQQIALEKQEQLIQEMHRENPQIVLSSDKQNSGQNITEEKINLLKKESERYNSLKENLLSTLNDNNQKTINRLTSGLNLNPPPDASANEKQLAAKIKNNLDKLNADNTSSGTSSADKNASLQNKVAIQNEILQDIKTLSTLQKARKEQENAAALLAAASNNPRPARENNPASSRNTPQDNTLASNIPAANRNNTQPATQRENNTRPENTANANNRTDMFSTKEVIYSVELSLKNNKDTSVSSLQSFISNNNPPLQNPEAENRKNTALDNLRYLQKEIEQAYQSGNTSNENTNTTTVTEQQIQQKVSQLDQEAENISSEIDQLRNSSSADKSLLSAKEQQLNSLKAESATLKMQLYSANDKAYMDAIQQGMDKLKSQNHSSLPDATALMDKINNLKKQSRQIREEAESLSGAARWGSLGNAEELEAEVLQNEKKLLDMLQGIYPELSYQPPKFTNISSSSSPDENQKKIIRQKQTQQVSELISLVNAYILNFESYKPDTRRMSDAQKQQWLELIKRRNLIQELARKANAENNPENKIRWLSTAVKESVVMTQQLNTFQTSTPPVAARTNNTSNDNINTRERETTIPVARNTNNAPSNVNNPPRERNVNNPPGERETNVPVAGNNTNRENTVANTNRITNRNNENTQPASENTAAGTQKLFVTDGMEIYNRNAYSDAKPIPINEPPPPGLIFRVQLGVFKNRLPNNAFRGLTPVSGETTSDGSVKYTAGNFRRFEVAAGVKKELNRNGYPDAFVVAYYNGKRISLAEAMQLMENEGKQPDIAQADNIRINADVRPIVPIVPANPTEEPATDLVVVSGELEKIKKLLYTVQIGVYSRQISKSRLKNLEPIYTEKLPGGLYRYTAGIYNIDTKVIADKNRVIALGITDAFVSAYLEGKRVNFNEIRQRISKGETFAFENENPIRFPSGAPSVPVATEENASTPPPDVIPYKNNVTQYPEATPENGIKNTEEGICFKVQIGAYSRQVPQDVAERFNKITTWPVEYKYINQLFIYNVGNFADKANAQKLRQEIINLGIPDAFITVYKDGKKLFGEEARSYLSGN